MGLIIVGKLAKTTKNQPKMVGFLFYALRTRRVMNLRSVTDLLKVIFDEINLSL
jgi:hypothetical protein